MPPSTWRHEMSWQSATRRAPPSPKIKVAAFSQVVISSPEARMARQAALRRVSLERKRRSAMEERETKLAEAAQLALRNTEHVGFKVRQLFEQHATLTLRDEAVQAHLSRTEHMDQHRMAWARSNGIASADPWRPPGHDRDPYAAVRGTNASSRASRQLPLPRRSSSAFQPHTAARRLWCSPSSACRGPALSTTTWPTGAAPAHPSAPQVPKVCRRMTAQPADDCSRRLEPTIAAALASADAAVSLVDLLMTRMDGRMDGEAATVAKRATTARATAAFAPAAAAQLPAQLPASVPMLPPVPPPAPPPAPLLPPHTSALQCTGQLAGDIVLGGLSALQQGAHRASHRVQADDEASHRRLQADDELLAIVEAGAGGGGGHGSGAASLDGWTDGGHALARGFSTGSADAAGYVAGDDEDFGAAGISAESTDDEDHKPSHQEYELPSAAASSSASAMAAEGVGWLQEIDRYASEAVNKVLEAAPPHRAGMSTCRLPDLSQVADEKRRWLVGQAEKAKRAMAAEAAATAAAASTATDPPVVSITHSGSNGSVRCPSPNTPARPPSPPDLRSPPSPHSRRTMVTNITERMSSHLADASAPPPASRYGSRPASAASTPSLSVSPDRFG